MSITTDRARRHTARSVIIRRIDDEMVSHLSHVAEHRDCAQERLAGSNSPPTKASTPRLIAH